MVKIKDIRSRRVWDSRGLPTLEVELHASQGFYGRGIAPAGASTGRREALSLLDGGRSLKGRDVTLAMDAIQRLLVPQVLGCTFEDLGEFDTVLHRLNGDPSSNALGANTTTAASLAMLDLFAQVRAVPRWQVLNKMPTTIPRPQIQIFGGGAHAANRVAVQDFMVYPMSALSIDDALVHVAEVYLAAGEIMTQRGGFAGVADEGGYWPNVVDTEDALDILVTAIEMTGLMPGLDMGISLDIAASQFFHEGRYLVGGSSFSSEDWISQLVKLTNDYPIVAIEDPADEDDDRGMKDAKENSSAVVIGDDYLVTDSRRIGGNAGAAVDGVLVKVNQVGSVSRAQEAVQAAEERKLAVIVSARSGETEDTSVAHLATGWSADVVKVGSITRGERTAKWNELIRISDHLGSPPLAAPISKT